jgi:hypothetical protein
VPKNGISNANKTNGTSISERLNTVMIGNLAIWVMVIIIAKYATNAGQFVMSVETATIIKSKPARILMCGEI